MKEDLIGFKVTKQEKEMLQALAEVQGTSISSLVREKVLTNDLDPDFLKSLFLFNMYKGLPIGVSGHQEVKFMISSFRKQLPKLNREQIRIARILISEAEKVDMALEYNPMDEYELLNPFKDPLDDFENTVWEYFLTVGKGERLE